MGGLDEECQTQGVLRWTLRRCRAHLNTFLVGGVLFALVAMTVGATLVGPADPTLGDRLLNGVLTLGVTVVAVLALLAPAVLIAAPYEQRNALRDLRRLESQARGRPSLSFRCEDHQAFPSLHVTNNGATDTFKVEAQITEPFRTKRLPLTWGVKKENKGRERELVPGEEDSVFLSLYDWDSNPAPEVTIVVRILSSSQPLERVYVARRTTLGRAEMRWLEEDWPPRPAEWFQAVRQVIADLEVLDAQLADLEPTASTDLTAATSDRLDEIERAYSVIGKAFIKRNIRLHGPAPGDVDTSNPDRLAQRTYIDAFRRVVAACRDDLVAAIGQAG